jgi:hypothetical protein
MDTPRRIMPEYAQKLITKDRFAKALANFPKSEIELFKKLADEVTKGEVGSDWTDERIRHQLVMQRLVNAICGGEGCRKRACSGFKLQHCSKCCLVFYCSRECQKRDWPKHKTWCCNPDAQVPKDCPYRPVFLKTNLSDVSEEEKKKIMETAPGTMVPIKVLSL